MSDGKMLFPDPGVRNPITAPLVRGWTQKVLDHGYVKFIDSMGTDETIVEAARMSTARGFVSWEEYVRCEKCDLIRHGALSLPPDPCPRGGVHAIKAFPHGDNGILTTLYRDRHHTPFEMCELHIEVYAPILVIREWFRHRMQSYNEMSARYVQMPNEHYVPDLCRFVPKQTGNKQADSVAAHVQQALGLGAAEAQGSVAREQEGIYDLYDTLLRGGVPKEVARVNTPVSRYSRFRAKTDLRNWLAFLTLRDHPAAQWEIQQYAKAVANIIKETWPRTYALYEEHTKFAVTLSRTEVEEIKALLKGDKYMPREDVLFTPDDDPQLRLSASLLNKFK